MTHPNEKISDERLIGDIVNLVRAAWNLCDGTANENPPEVDQDDWNRLSAALDRLDALDPPPGVVAGPGAKVEYALQSLRAAQQPAPEEDGEVVAWLHPTAGWARTKYHSILPHCRKDGPQPVPLVRQSALVKRDAEIEAYQRQLANPWCPDACPITQRPFFMWIDGEPTYGGPFDSYTIPTRDTEGEYSCRRYDHDEGGWKDWSAGLAIKVVDEGDWITLEDRAEAAEARAAAAEKRFMDHVDYSIDLARIIEALCSNRDPSEPKTTARHHYEMAIAYRSTLPASPAPVVTDAWENPDMDPIERTVADRRYSEPKS